MKLSFSKLSSYFFVACAALALLAGCNGGVSEQSGVKVSGAVSSGAVVAGVAVTATDANGVVTESSVTNEAGQYSMTLKDHGSYVLTVPFNDVDGTPGVLSSVFASDSDATGSARVNINPMTSIITSRVVGTILTAAPSGEVVKNAAITSKSIAQAEQAISALFATVSKKMNMSADESDSPISATTHAASLSDSPDNVFSLASFTVRTNQVAIGSGADRVVLSIPAKGALPAVIPEAAANSMIASGDDGEVKTRTPIKHLIVVIGENQTFDTIFGTYKPSNGQKVKNLLSQKIVNEDGTPGPKFNRALQNKALPQSTYSINPIRSVAFAALPQPLQIGEVTPDLQRLGGTPDPNFPANLPNGPFQLTKYVPYASVTPVNPIGTTTGDPVHRFFQMWQQTGGTNQKLDMFAWVAVSTGQGGDTPGITPANPSQGGELMAFLNMHAGDAAFWKSLAQHYAISDNYHQSILGGTGANFFAIATGDVPYFNVNNVPAAPPANQIENPNPMAGTENFYIQDGYEGGSYVNCSDPAQPGVAPILSFLMSKNIKSKCEPGTYYLVNNYAPGYDMNGNVQPIGPNNYTLPPQTVPTIAEALSNKGVTWKWYTGARELADVTAIAQFYGVPPTFAQTLLYNAIGDPLVASKNIMTTWLKNNLAGTTTLYNDIQQSTREQLKLPAVSFVVPSNLDSGHPGFSVQQKYETFIQNLIQMVQANPALWPNTAIIITTDEGGGYFDTGSIQTQDFFGDGPRIPMIVVSPYARTNFVDHTYYDHASILKFIERNWKLKPLSKRSRDNHPNPVTTPDDVYQPINKKPAIGDLMPMFDF